MTQQDFEHLVNTYGANPQRWPQSKRTAALLYMETQKAATDTVLRQARALDAWLDTGTHPSTDNSLLMARIRKQAADTPQDPPQSGPVVSLATYRSRPPMWRTLAATVLVTTGIGFGVGQAAARSQTETVEALLSASLGDMYSDSDFNLGGTSEALQ